MQPPHDTQRLPAYDPTSDPHAAAQPTESFAAAGSGGGGGGGGGYGQAPGHGSGSGSGSRPRRRLGTGALVAIGAAALVLVLIVGLIGLEFGLRKSVTDRLEQEATTALGSTAQVELGPRPVVLSILDDTLGSVRITTDGTPAEGATGPAPVVDMTAEGVRSEGELTHIDSLSGTVFVSDEAMTTAAAGETSGSDSPLGGLITVQSVTADPASGTLKVSVSGVAEATVVPRVDRGRLQLDPEQASIFGFQLPASLLGGTLSMMDTTLEELPDGVEVTNARVVDGGMTLDVNGADVVLEQQPR